MKKRAMKEVGIHMKMIARKKEHILGVALLSAYVLLTLVYYIKQTHGADMQSMYAPYEYDALSDWSVFYQYLYTMFPFVVVLFSGFSFFHDTDSGEIALLQTRMGLKKYYRTKLLAIGIVAALSFALPFLAGLFFDWITFPDGAGVFSNVPPYSTDYERFGMNISPWYFSHPWLYHIFKIFLIAVFTGMAVMFTSLFAFYHFHFRILFFLPFYILCLLTSLLSSLFPGVNTGIQAYITSEGNVNYQIPGYLFLWIIVLGLGTVLLLRNVEKKIL